MTDNTRKVRPLADDYVTVWESPDPEGLYAYSPGIIRLDSGRLIATMDSSGPKSMELLDEPHWTERGDGSRAWKGRVFTSDDGGRTWTHQTDYPFLHARPFASGGSQYVLGQADDLMVIRSDDDGATWSEPVKLTEGDIWHQAPCNVWYANGCVYLVMEKRVHTECRGWPVSDFAQVLMRGRVDTDLTKRENWSFASELAFIDALPGPPDDPAIDMFGVPFYPNPYPGFHYVYGDPKRASNPIGWLETNVVQILDPDHTWRDPTGRTFHLLARAHTGGTGYATLTKVIEQGSEPGTGAMETTLEKVPSGRSVMYLPCPGGQMKFHVLYDDVTKLYWLLSTQATDSMTRADRLPSDRFNLPNNERRRLQLHFSKNLVDWCFAGLVATGPVEVASRHYASMVFDGDDLHVLSRSGDERAHDPHNGNILTFHTVSDFRGLVY
jgi:hypothetical protein